MAIVSEIYLFVGKGMDYQIKTLGGLTCIFAPMQEGNSITIDIGIKAGSLYETEAEAGLSHFLEHLFFKGGKKWKTPKEVAIAVDKIGAECNACTGEHTTHYYIKCAPNFAEYAVEILADMLVDAQFLPEELEREKGVVIQELKMYEDNPRSVLAEKWKSFFFGERCRGRPIIGYEEQIRSFTQQMLFDYKKQLYTKDNLVITIAGNIKDQASLENQILQLFSALPEKKTRQKPEFTWQLPAEQYSFFSKKTEQNHLIISAPGIAGLQKEKYAANLLCKILGGNMSSRLFQEIREKLGLCYYISASHSQCTEYGLFLIRAGIDKEKFAFGLEKINAEIDRFLQEGCTDEEFENAKNYLLGGIQMGIESSDEMADFLGGQWLAYGEIQTLEQLLANYQAIKKEEVQSLFPLLSAEKRFTYHIE